MMIADKPKKLYVHGIECNMHSLSDGIRKRVPWLLSVQEACNLSHFAVNKLRRSQNTDPVCISQSNCHMCITALMNDSCQVEGHGIAVWHVLVTGVGGFRQVCSEVVILFGYTLQLRWNVMAEPATKYAEATRLFGAFLENLVGFNDWRKIIIFRPGGANKYQRSCYNGDRKFHFLTYQIISTPDDLLFGLFGPEVGRKTDLTLY